jgi:cysteine desulfurase/selenocysteine lyase
MFNPFKSKLNDADVSVHSFKDFEYLSSSAYYFDSACQSLRPEQVINAQNEYYHKFNSCGHRVKYKWGEQTDAKIEACRASLLSLMGKNDKKYTVAFGLNTTFGINSVLMQISSTWLRDKGIESIVTSEIEHNSVFLPSMVFAKKHNLKRKVLPRNLDGSLKYEIQDIEKVVVILNTTSNIDGRELLNVEKLANDVHTHGGIILIDACQTLSHHPELLEKTDFDAVFGSGHKMYGPSVGFSIVKKELVSSLDCYLIGGSTVQDVSIDDYELIEDEHELYARIEPGLQNYAGIIGLGEAIKWRQNFHFDLTQVQTKLSESQIDLKELSLKPNQQLTASEYELVLSHYLHQKLKNVPNIVILNPEPSPIVSLHTTKENLDGHKLAMYLSEAGIMSRSGYHCCHYYLKSKLNLPPLFRISLGLNNTLEQIDYLIEKLSFLTKS